MISPAEVIARLLLGALLGGIIGFERQSHGRPAGFRTHLLVCLSSVLVMLISEHFHRDAAAAAYLRVDPGRIAAGAITGVGFLGAGVIIKSGGAVRGLTTAACIWVVSAIGLAVGSGLYLAAVTSFVVTYLALWVLRKAESVMPSVTHDSLTVVAGPDCGEDAVADTLRRQGVSIVCTGYEIDREQNECTYHFTLTRGSRSSLGAVNAAVASCTGVKRTSLRPSP